MPHTRSAKKRLRKADRARLRNRAAMRTIKTYLKRVNKAAEEDTLEALQAECKNAIKLLDKAAARNVMHRNKAARLKSRVAKTLHGKRTQPQGEASA